MTVILRKGKRYSDEELIIINSDDFLFTCSDCKITKPNKDFYKTKRKELKRGRFYTCYCKECRNNYSRSKYNSSETRRLFLVNRNFGLDKEDYEDLYRKSNGSCAICNVKEEELSQRLSIDHNHITGQVRGLLCSKCNSGLGLLKDNIDILNNAIKYLEKYK